jgi:hypothetical protein
MKTDDWRTQASVGLDLGDRWPTGADFDRFFVISKARRQPGSRLAAIPD